MGVIAKGIPRGCQGLFTPVSLGYPLSVFNKNSTLKTRHVKIGTSNPALRIPLRAGLFFAPGFLTMKKIRNLNPHAKVTRVARGDLALQRSAAARPKQTRRTLI